MPSTRTKRSVAYARTASRQQADRGAIERQLRACRRAASERGLTLAQEFADDGASGLTLERAALRELLAYVAANPVDYVICSDAARLARDYQLFRSLMRQLRTCQARVIFADDVSRDATTVAQSRERS